MIVLDQESITEARLTISLIVLNVVCYFLAFMGNDNEYFFLFAQVNSSIINDYEYWRLFSSMFLHSDLLHLFMNMFALLLYGSLVERFFKKHEYLIIYFLSGFLGNLFTLLLYPPNSLSVGASGAIFGLLGAAIILVARSNERTVLVLAIIYLVYFLMASFQPGINAWAHLFGLMGGLLFGYLFNQTRFRGPKRNDY
jgi:rhomboid protease GluP